MMVDNRHTFEKTTTRMRFVFDICEYSSSQRERYNVASFWFFFRICNDSQCFATRLIAGLELTVANFSMYESQSSRKRQKYD